MTAPDLTEDQVAALHADIATHQPGPNGGCTGCEVPDGRCWIRGAAVGKLLALGLLDRDDLDEPPGP